MSCGGYYQVNDEGFPVILGVTEGRREDKESRSNFLCSLKEEGLKRVSLIVSDKCLGLYEIIGDFFPVVKCQRCFVHRYRNAFTMCPRKHLHDVVTSTLQKTERTEQAIRKNGEEIRRFRRDFSQAPKGFVMISSSPLYTAGRRTFLHVLLNRQKGNRCKRRGQEQLPFRRNGIFCRIPM